MPFLESHIKVTSVIFQDEELERYNGNKRENLTITTDMTNVLDKAIFYTDNCKLPITHLLDLLTSVVFFFLSLSPLIIPVSSVNNFMLLIQMDA